MQCTGLGWAGLYCTVLFCLSVTLVWCGVVGVQGVAVAKGGSLTLPPFSVCFVVAECTMG